LLKRGDRNPSPYGLEAFRYGCSCGQCLREFLSKQMSFSLHTQANYLAINSRNWIWGFGEDTWLEKEHHLQELPTKVYRKLETDDSMREGYIRLVEHISTYLRHGKVPTEENILETSRVQEAGTQNLSQGYLRRGGTMRSAVQPLFELAIDHDEILGDEELRRLQEVYAEEIEQLPRCRNDFEFGLVLRRCGFVVTLEIPGARYSRPPIVAIALYAKSEWHTVGGSKEGGTHHNTTWGASRSHLLVYKVAHLPPSSLHLLPSSLHLLPSPIHLLPSSFHLLLAHTLFPPRHHRFPLAETTPHPCRVSAPFPAYALRPLRMGSIRLGNDWGDDRRITQSSWQPRGTSDAAGPR
jgi:hypothetical protein